MKNLQRLVILFISTSNAVTKAFILPSQTSTNIQQQHQPKSQTTTTTTAFLAKNILQGKEIENDFTPMNNMVLVQKAEVIEQTGGGIFLTGKDKISRSEGVVITTGPGRINSETGFLYPVPISNGETVIFGKYDGEELMYNSKKHMLIRDDDVLVKFPPNMPISLENAELTWDNVLVKVIERDVEATGGILISATVKKSSSSSIAQVLKVGPGKYAFNGVLMPMDVKEGDFVKYRDFAAQDVSIGNQKYAVVKMIDILAKF